MKKRIRGGDGWRWRRPAASCLPLLLSACAVLHPPAPEPAATPRLSTTESLTRLYAPPAPPAAEIIKTVPVVEAVTTLTLTGVLTLARANNPNMAVFDASRAAARAEVLEAAAWPNPELELGLGIARSRDEPAETRPEYGLGLSQLIEWPAKRRARRAAAEAGLPVVEREADEFRARLRAEVSRAYVVCVFQREALEQAGVALAVEQAIERTVAQRVEAGEAPEIDLIQARVERLRAMRLIERQRRELGVAETMLRHFCGEALPARFALEDILDDEVPAVDPDAARDMALSQHPALLRLEEELRRQRRVIERERTAWYPELRPGLNAGRAIDADTFGFGLGLVLPLWNRNRAGIAAAGAEHARLEALLEVERRNVRRDVDAALETYTGSREQQAAFSGGLLNAAREALRIETFLYEEGETDMLRLLEARRTARQTENEYLQAVYQAHIARIELEQAVGLGGDE